MSTINKNLILVFILIFVLLNLCLACDKKKCDKPFKDCIKDNQCQCKSIQSYKKPTNNKTFAELICSPSINCVKCMGKLYMECCSCVDGLCQKSKQKEDLSRISYVGDFEGEPGLFKALTRTTSEKDKWAVITFQNDLKKLTGDLNVRAIPISDYYHSIDNQCTVIFMNNCLSSVKCENSCESFGSDGYRWFHNGCCECLGQRCLNFGIDNSKCKVCGNENNMKNLWVGDNSEKYCYADSYSSDNFCNAK